MTDLPRCLAPRLGKLRKFLRGRASVSDIEPLASTGPLADARLVPDMVQALGGCYGWDFVFERMTPQFGVTLAHALRGALQPDGRLESGRRLAAIVLLERDRARDLIEPALVGGTRWMREGALKGMAAAGFAPPDLENEVLAATRHTSEGVRRAALEALANYSSDAALECLLRALPQMGFHAAVQRAVGRCANPHVPARLVDLLRTKPPATPAKVILSVLAQRHDPRAPQLAVNRLADCGPTAASVILAGDDPAALTHLAGQLDTLEENLWPAAALAATKLGPGEAFRRLSPLFASESDIAKDPKIEAAVAALGPGADPRWFALLLEKARGRPCLEAAMAIDGLAQLGDRRAIPALSEMLPAAPDPIAHRIIFALAAFRDPKTCDVILRACSNTIMIMLAVTAAMHCIGPASLPVLQRHAKHAKGPKRKLLLGVIKDLKSAKA